MIDPKYIRKRLVACAKEPHDVATDIIIDILLALNERIDELARELRKEKP